MENKWRIQAEAEIVLRLLQQGESLRIVLRDARQVDRPAARLADFQGVLEGGHHAQPEEIHLDDAEILAVVLVPLRHHAPRHRRVFERHDRIELALADDHAAAVLAEMPGQPAQALVEGNERGQPRMRRRQPR